MTFLDDRVRELEDAARASAAEINKLKQHVADVREKHRGKTKVCGWRLAACGLSGLSGLSGLYLLLGVCMDGFRFLCPVPLFLVLGTALPARDNVNNAPLTPPCRAHLLSDAGGPGAHGNSTTPGCRGSVQSPKEAVGERDQVPALGCRHASGARSCGLLWLWLPLVTAAVVRG